MTKDDAELAAMSTIASVLEPLNESTRVRVFNWAADRFGVSLQKRKGLAGKGQQTTEDREWEDIGTFFSTASPRTDAEKALVVGYWLQEVIGQDNFESTNVNKELKHLGHGISNITRAFDNLKSRKPAYAIQTQKSGKSKQSRKRYKITTEGVKKVQVLLDGDEQNET